MTSPQRLTTREVLETILRDGPNMSFKAMTVMLEGISAADVLAFLEPIELDLLMHIMREAARAERSSSNPPPSVL